MYYLYIKTHNKTGKKYLGQTARDPYTYSGSGIKWKQHLEEYGNDISTIILLGTESKQELKETGIFFSELFNIVESDDWKNEVKETGTGYSSELASELAKLRIRRGTHHFIQPGASNRNPSEETRQKMSLAKQGMYDGEKNPMYGKIHTKEARKKISDRIKERGGYHGKNNPAYGIKREDLSARNRLPKRWVTNGVEDKLVLREEATQYLNQGYWVGRSKSNN